MVDEIVVDDKKHIFVTTKAQLDLLKSRKHWYVPYVWYRIYIILIIIIARIYIKIYICRILSIKPAICSWSSSKFFIHSANMCGCNSSKPI